MKLVISVGSYERILYGIDVDITDAVSVKEAYAIPAHTGIIKAVSSCGKYLATGGTDETIRIFDLRKRKDIGTLTQHNGSVNTIGFVGSSHLLSGGADGRISLFRTKDWECLHILQHKKVVKCLAIHPSGKIALSIGQGRSLKLWNLITGKQAYNGKTSTECDKVSFSSEGKYYAVLSEHLLSIFETESVDLKPLFEFKSSIRLSAMAWRHEEFIYLAGEGDIVQIIDVSKVSEPSHINEVIKMTTEQLPRIKDLAIIEDVLITASSSGSIKGWRIPSNINDSHVELFKHESRIRVTCLTASRFM